MFSKIIIDFLNVIPNTQIQVIMSSFPDFESYAITSPINNRSVIYFLLFMPFISCFNKNYFFLLLVMWPTKDKPMSSKSVRIISWELLWRSNENMSPKCLMKYWHTNNCWESFGIQQEDGKSSISREVNQPSKSIYVEYAHVCVLWFCL